MAQPQLSHLRRRLHFRLRNPPSREMRFLEDDQGWLYIERLIGSPDFGPYMKEELMLIFDIEPEPLAGSEIRLRSDASSSDETDGSG